MSCFPTAFLSFFFVSKMLNFRDLFFWFRKKKTMEMKKKVQESCGKIWPGSSSSSSSGIYSRIKLKRIVERGREILVEQLAYRRNSRGPLYLYIIQSEW